MIDYKFNQFRHTGEVYAPPRKKETDEERMERARISKQQQQEEIDKVLQEYVYPLNHPIPESVRDEVARFQFVNERLDKQNKYARKHERQHRIRSLEEYKIYSDYMPPRHSKWIYTLDENLNITSWYPSLTEARYGHGLGRTMMFEYIRRGMFNKKHECYFVLVKDYESFISSKKVEIN